MLKKSNLPLSLLFLLSLLCLAASLYLQYQVALKPCPLCLMQRMSVGLLTAGSLLGLLFPKIKASRVYWGFLALFILAGLYFVTRQLWLMHLPASEVPPCMPSLEILMTYFHWTQVLKALIWGGGSCAEVSYRILGFSLASWSMAYFLMAAAVLAVAFKWRKK